VSIGVFLEDLRRRDIQLRLDGEQLCCNAPAGALTSDLRDQLQQRKSEVVNFLRLATACADQQHAIVPLQPNGTHVPVFAVPGHNGDVFCFRALSRHLGTDQPFFGLQPPGLESNSLPLQSVEALAAHFAAQILAVRPQGTCIIAGYCAGGTIAFELARQLAQKGVAIRFVVLFGSPDPGWYRFVPQLRHRFREQMARLSKHVHTLVSLSYREKLGYFSQKLQQRRLKHEAGLLAEQPADAVLDRRLKVEAATIAALRRYTPSHFFGDVNVFLPSKAWQAPSFQSLRWQSSIASRVVEYCGPDACDGDTMLREPHALAIADLFRACRDTQQDEASQPVKPLASDVRRAA
jgi:thioesterase domain-containing protein